MEEIIKEEKKLEKVYNKALKIFAAAITLIWLLQMFMKKLGIEFYITSIIILWIGFFINPLLKLVLFENKEDSHILKGISIVAGCFFAAALSFVSYSVIFSQNISTDSNYRLYEGIIVSAIAFILIKYIYPLLGEIRNLPDENRNFDKYFVIMLKYLFILLFTFALPLYQFCDKKYEISLKNIQVPASLEVSVISNPVIIENFSEQSSEITIEDPNLINELTAEIRNIRLENIRNLDKLNFDIMDARSIDYATIIPRYKPSTSISSAPQNIYSNYFHAIKLYDNGQVILETFIEKGSVLKNNFVQAFRLPLSKDLVNKLEKAIRG